MITGATKTEQLKDNLAAVEVWLLPHMLSFVHLSCCRSPATVPHKPVLRYQVLSSDRAASVACSLQSFTKHHIVVQLVPKFTPELMKRIDDIVKTKPEPLKTYGRG